MELKHLFVDWSADSHRFAQLVYDYFLSRWKHGEISIHKILFGC